MTQQITPPTESPSARASRMSASIFAAVAGWGQRVGVASTCFSVGALGAAGMRMSPTLSTHAMMRAPQACLSTVLATAPAATRAAVSRAEERPPPSTARMPYFAS